MARMGIVLHHGIETGAQLRELGEGAERAGMESLWVTERHFHEETFSALGYLAACTTRLRLGVGVANPYTRHPALLAMAAATLDRISGGRFLLGLGRSESFVIRGRLGLEYEKPLDTLAETVRLVRVLLSGEKVASHQDRFTLREAHLETKPVQTPLPIYLAAIGPRALRLAGAVADGVLLNAYAPAGYVRYAVSEVKAGAAQAGRDPATVDVACMLPIRLADDPAPLMPALKQRVVRLLAEPHVGELLLEKGGFDAGILPAVRQSDKTDRGKSVTRLITDAMVEAFYVVGPAATCEARVQEYRQAGVDLPLLLPLLEDFGAVATALGG